MEHFHEIFDSVRFAQETANLAFTELRHCCFLAVRRAENYLHVRPDSAQFVKDFGTWYSRQRHIEQDYVEPRRVRFETL